MTFDVYPDISKPGRPPIYPFCSMEVGDRQFMAGKTIRQVTRRVSDHRPKKFRCRTLMIKGVPGVMVTRIA